MPVTLPDTLPVTLPETVPVTFPENPVAITTPELGTNLNEDATDTPAPTKLVPKGLKVTKFSEEVVARS